MKRSTLLFTFGVVAFLAMVLVLMIIGGARYSWKLTLQPDDEQPFGACLFDSLMHVSLPQPYQARSATAAEWARRSDPHRRQSVLYMGTGDNYISSTEVNALLAMAARGDRVMVVSMVPTELRDTLGYETCGLQAWFDYRALRREMAQFGRQRLDTLRLEGRGAYPPAEVSWVEGFCSAGLRPLHSGAHEVTVLARFAERDSSTYYVGPEFHHAPLREPVAVRFSFGRGYVYVVTPVYPFTNYGVTDPACRTFILRMMDELKDYPVTRLYERRAAATAGFAPLAFVLAHPPLRLAWWLVLAGAVLLLTVNARRRQRAIPVRRREVNDTIAYLTRWASLYRRGTDHQPLVEKAYRAFVRRMGETWRIDLTDSRREARTAQARLLATILHREASAIAADLWRIDDIRTATAPVTPAGYREALRLLEGMEMYRS